MAYKKNSNQVIILNLSTPLKLLYIQQNREALKN